MVSVQFYISIARMHHISNPHKFQRLKRHALQANVSGLVKKGKPGVLVFDGERGSIKTFLDNARGLRYLDFHHVDTQPLVRQRIAGGTPGLHEVKDMGEFVNALDTILLKAWFREQLGMGGSGPPG